MGWSQLFYGGVLSVSHYFRTVHHTHTHTHTHTHKTHHLFSGLEFTTDTALQGRWFDSQWCNWNFSWTWSLRPHYDTGVDSTSNRNEYQEYFLEAKGGRWVGLITQPPSCADCLEIWDPNHLEPSEPLQALTELLYLCFFLSRVCAVKNLSILDVKVIVTGSLLPTHLQKSHIILWELATVWKFNVVFMVFDTIVDIVSLTQRIPKLVS